MWLSAKLMELLQEYKLGDPKQEDKNSNPWVKFDGIFKDDPLFDDFVENMAVNGAK
ncbi:hypothetical protein GS682_05025 [Nostoc sp. B(2019)]|nr:hypothetical protein [Nostoc sp. B(2019)]